MSNATHSTTGAASDGAKEQIPALKKSREIRGLLTKCGLVAIRESGEIWRNRSPSVGLEARTTSNSDPYDRVLTSEGYSISSLLSLCQRDTAIRSLQNFSTLLQLQCLYGHRDWSFQLRVGGSACKLTHPTSKDCETCYESCRDKSSCHFRKDLSDES
jgi:hypothetical protein